MVLPATVIRILPRFEAFLHMLVCARVFLAVRACFALKHDQIRNDVGRHPASIWPMLAVVS